MQGRVIKGIGGFYYISAGAQVYECRARGKFRLDDIAPLAGDRVVFEPGSGEAFGYLTKILPRKNVLVRPPVANVDQFVMVLSAANPKPDFLLCDKLLLQAQRQSVAPLIVLNKCDIAEDDVMDSIARDYMGYDFFIVSAKSGEGLDALKDALHGKLSCFAGQSAVGKSSLINALCRSFSLSTGELSKKIGRGKHTTRAAELLDMDGNGYVVDTPGFSILELDEMPPERLQEYYPELSKYLGKCRFIDCLHDAEPDCEVKNAANSGEIPFGRYERYRAILAELIDKQKRKYN